MTSIAEVLFSTTQQRLLSLLYGQPKESFYFKQILRLTGMGVATIKRELDRMVEARILTRTVVGNQHHYQANPACPVHDELAGIVRKTLGITSTLKAALAPLADRIERAFLFGSAASGREEPGSDIDLLVIGELGLGDVVRALYPTQEALQREINPKVFRQSEWENLVRSGDAFARDVMRKPRIDLVGDSQ